MFIEVFAFGGGRVLREFGCSSWLTGYIEIVCYYIREEKF